MFANLFLHHFRDEDLRKLLKGIADRTNFFMASEPRRTRVAFFGTRLVGLLGCNRITRHDARLSVEAGFIDEEIGHCWPAPNHWAVSEKPAGIFSHCFVARRTNNGPLRQSPTFHASASSH
jgi:hypothetical protein